MCRPAARSAGPVLPEHALDVGRSGLRCPDVDEDAFDRLPRAPASDAASGVIDAVPRLNPCLGIGDRQAPRRDTASQARPTALASCWCTPTLRRMMSANRLRSRLYQEAPAPSAVDTTAESNWLSSHQSNVHGGHSRLGLVLAHRVGTGGTA